MSYVDKLWEGFRYQGLSNKKDKDGLPQREPSA